MQIIHVHLLLSEMVTLLINLEDMHAAEPT